MGYEIFVGKHSSKSGGGFENTKVYLFNMVAIDIDSICLMRIFDTGTAVGIQLMNLQSTGSDGDVQGKKWAGQWNLRVELYRS